MANECFEKIIYEHRIMASCLLSLTLANSKVLFWHKQESIPEIIGVLDANL